MRKDVKEAIYFMKKNNIKVNYAAIARQYDCDYRTVKKHFISNDEVKIPRKKRVIHKKTDGYEEIIKEKYIENKAPVIAIYNLLKDSYGYTGSYSTLKRFTNTLKEDVKKEVTVRFETSPGLQCQIDWKEELSLTSKNGEVFTINVFLSILGYSRYKFIKLTLDRTQETLFKCLNDCIVYFNGVPKEFLFDNMKTVVDRSRTQYGKAVYNNVFYEFSKDAFYP